MTNDLNRQILDAAAQLFTEQGYRAGVDAIAAAAGVSKQTIYNHFGSKEALFGAVARSCSQELIVPLAGGSDLRDALLGFARSLRTRLMSPEGIARHRMLVAEATRFPEAADRVFDSGHSAVHGQLTEVLRRAMAAGLLRSEEPEFAAGILLSLLAGFDRERRLFGRPPHADEESRPARIVDLFLRAFAPGCDGPRTHE